MKKRLTVFLLILTLIFGFPVNVSNVSAAGAKSKKISVASSYCIENNLYTFVQMGKAFGTKATKVMRVDNGTATGKEVSPVPIKKCGSIVRYMFMVDLSGSMREHTGEINAFVKSVMDTEGGNAVYTVASFGERFEVVSKDQTDKNAVIKTFDGLDYNEQLTNPFSAVVNAINYLESCPIRGGDLVNLILISDGEPDLGYSDKAKEKKAEKKAAKKALKKINSATDIVFSTVVLSDKKSGAFSSFAKGSGKNLTVKSESEGKKSGKKIVSFVKSLCLVNLPLREIPYDDSISIDLLFYDESNPDKRVMMNKKLSSVKVLKGFSASSVDGANGSNKTPEDKENPEDDNDKDGNDSQNTGGIKGGVTYGQNNTENKMLGFQKYIIIILFVVVIILFCIFIFAIFSKKGKKKNSDAGEDMVSMKLEIISGKCDVSDRELNLSNQIIIGSGNGCDLVFKEKDVSKQNTRIFIKDKMIFIEDLNSKNGTVLEGMKLHGANRLRSGDEISIGSVRFKMKF